MVVFAGVVVIETSATGVTVSKVLPATLPSVAEIVVVPTFVVVARPFDPPALLIEATEGAEEAHVTDVVMFCVELSVYVPVAVNCCCEPLETEGEAGVTAIETSVAGVTVNCVEPLTLPSVAEIVVVPTLSELARPIEPGALLMVATPVLAEPQVTVALKSCVEPSE
jgi:hypothetical protein